VPCSNKAFEAASPTFNLQQFATVFSFRCTMRDLIWFAFPDPQCKMIRFPQPEHEFVLNAFSFSTFSFHFHFFFYLFLRHNTISPLDFD